MAEPSILGALRDPQFRADTLRNLVDALNGAKRSLTVGSLGAVGDMGSTLANLVRAGAGTAYHEATGRPIPQALEYRDPARDFGTSASLGNFAESQGWLPPQTFSMPEQAGALLGPIVAMKAPDLANSTLRGLVSALKSEPSRRMVEGLVDGMGARPKIFAGEGAQTADMQALAKAQQLEKAGAPERAIWSDTGWFKGADGKWRFEIDDSGASVDVGKIPSGMSMIGDLPKARGVVAHGRLFDAYPEVADNTYMGRVSDGGGSFSDMSNRGPYKGLVNLNPNGHEGANSVALHELQHAVQQREGFARGGSPSQFTQLPPDFRLTAQQLISVDETAKRLGESVDDVARLSLEPTLAQRVNELVRSGQWDANVNEWRQNILPPQQQYERLAGEAEARAVQSRMNMTPEQRRASFPFDSYDVPRDKLILRDLLKGPAEATETRLNAVTKPEYGIDHRPMTVEGGASQLHDLTPSFGDDIYGPNALQFFGSGDPREKSVVGLLKKIRGNPDALVTIYRGVPDGAPQTINPGDWITLDKNAASDYGRVVEMKVPASHVTSWADSLLEFGYYPPGKKP